MQRLVCCCLKPSIVFDTVFSFVELQAYKKLAYYHTKHFVLVSAREIRISHDAASASEAAGIA